MAEQSSDPLKGISLMTWAAAGGNLGFHRFACGRYLSGAALLLLFIVSLFLLLGGALAWHKHGTQWVFVLGAVGFCINALWVLVDLWMIWRGRFEA